MKSILTIIGARPQIIKSAAISRAIRLHFRDQLREMILHTGQHYDHNMSQVFFEEMQIPAPDFNLGVGSGMHGAQTATMIAGIEEVIQREKPDAVLVYGDTNSTLAAAVAASKVHVPVIHVEAGLRSFDKKMPEEINRILCDHVSTLLFSPTQEGIQNLAREGFDLRRQPPYSMNAPGVYHCGDVMLDNTLHFSSVALERSGILKKTGVQSGSFVLVTIHRDSNTDVPERLHGILNALVTVADDQDLVFPVHPRTLKMLRQDPSPDVQAFMNHKRIHLIEPVSFLDMIRLEDGASMIITDSGGVQKEAFFLHKPCVILRPHTEWIEIVRNGNAILADADAQRIRDAYSILKNREDLTWPDLFGDGHAAEFICARILETLS